MQQYDLISIGDSTIDVFLEISPTDTQSVCQLREEECLVCFDYGSKIPVETIMRVAGVGNAANNAIGTTRLGLKTAIYTVIGSDKDSQEIKQVFLDEDVSTEYLVMENGKRANLSTVINYSGERTIFVYHESRNYNLPDLAPSKWVYYTSVAKGHKSLHTQIPEYVRKTGAKLGFNPGSYQLREGLEVLKPILEITAILSVNREEAHMLAGGDLEDTKGLFNKLKEAGPQLILITDGRNGSYASYDGREIWHIGIPEDSPVVERTGCGDAYTTAFIAALIQGKELPEAMLWGTMNATSVIQHVGAREGLLTKSGIEDFKEKWGKGLKARMS